MQYLCVYYSTNAETMQVRFLWNVRLTKQSRYAIIGKEKQPQTKHMNNPQRFTHHRQMISSPDRQSGRVHRMIGG